MHNAGGECPAGRLEAEISEIPAEFGEGVVGVGIERIEGNGLFKMLSCEGVAFGNGFVHQPASFYVLAISIRVPSGRSRLTWGHDDTFDGSGEAVSTPRQSLDKARMLGSIAQRLPQTRHDRIQVVFEVDEYVAVPETIAEFFASDDLSRMFEQRTQHLERLLAQRNTVSAFAQLTCREI